MKWEYGYEYGVRYMDNEQRESFCFDRVFRTFNSYYFYYHGERCAVLTDGMNDIRGLPDEIIEKDYDLDIANTQTPGIAREEK